MADEKGNGDRELKPLEKQDHIDEQTGFLESQTDPEESKNGPEESKAEPSEQTKLMTGSTAKDQEVAVNIEDSATGSNMATAKVMVGVIVSVAVVIVAVILGICLNTLHTIDEGNVGIYYKYGALMDSVTEPGMHSMAPFITSVKQVKIRPETSTLSHMEAITQDGIQISFQEVQVISRVRQDKLISVIKRHGLNFKEPLVFDRVKEDIRIFCANHTIDDVYNVKFLDIVNEVRARLTKSIQRLGDGGVEILNLVVPKPDIPNDIANNYKQVKVQWTEQLVANQKQKTEQIKKETEKINAIADAQRTKSVLEITIQEKILEREGAQNISRISNNILKEKEENLANIEKYKIEKEAEANSKLYTSEYVKLNLAKSLSNNTKFYFSGESSPLGSLLTKIIN